ncbi:MAG: substrate-binding domain-containing protein, partial [Candidatus Methanoperedenaceae archaeon]|nr:substrate-binding domain-containing protein [Candidatus Methanoperedenaceae archaeon]
MNGKIIATIIITIFITALFSGCVDNPETETIRVSGAFALYPMMLKWGEEYQKLHPNVKFDIQAGGAGKGLTDTLGGLVDIGMVSRKIAASEEEKGAYWISV